MTFERNISNKIRNLRKSLNLTQAEFGNLVGISGNYLSEIESGKRKPTFELMNFIINEYEVSPNELFGYKQNETPDKPDIKEYIDNQIKKALQDMEGFRA